MRIFLSLLTLYTYPNAESRAPLNRQEASKFLDAFQDALPVEKLLIVSDVSREEFRERLKGLTEEEKRDFQMVLRAVGRFSGDSLNWKKVNLLDYGEVKTDVVEALRLMLGGARGRVEVHANLGCGRKVASIATYVALMELAHGDLYSRMTRCRFRVRPYQVEEGKVTEFPVLPVECISVDMGTAMEMLGAVGDGTTMEALRAGTPPGRKDFDRALGYLRKFRYVEFRDGTIYPTTRGRTMLRVWDAVRKPEP